MEKLERLSRKLVYKGTVLELYNDEVKDCEGNVQIYDSIIHKPCAKCQLFLKITNAYFYKKRLK